MEVKSDYKLNQKLGKGAFGEIYQGQMLKTNQQVAIKIESIQSKTPQLLQEGKFYQQMHKDRNAKLQIPEIYHCSSEGSNRVLIMELLGPSLENLFDSCDRKFSVTTVLKLTLQCLDRIEFVHSHNLIHRDIKPQNFLVGIGDQTDKIYIIDFGMAKQYQIKGDHIHEKKNVGMTGTCRFSSRNAHEGNQQSRKDDLISLGYMSVYFLKKLPWQGIQKENKEEKFDKVLEKKIGTDFKDLCQGCPQEFNSYFEIVNSMDFYTKPDYQQLKKLFNDSLVNQNLNKNDPFDWEQLVDTDPI